ncbi:MAG: gliding motility-associated C-terminal domain-containing protein [Bacteroidales bacterium]|nr:gliding motility-associated C-terminal domain-containing protein [Bacteroidales bacterium]
MRFRILIIFLALTLTANAQITAPGSGATRYTNYISTGNNDPVFIFCNYLGNTTGHLVADSPGGSAPFDFVWTKWDESVSAFSIPVAQHNDVLSSEISGLSEGGYRVEISDGTGYSTALTAWVHLDRPRSSASLRDFKCNYVALSGFAAIDTFYYADLNNGTPIMLPNDYRFRWSSEPESSIPFPEIEINPQTFNPPLEDVWYNLHVVDSFGCAADSSFFYESIHVKADFEIDPTQGEAPLEVLITDNSVRASTYRWEFGDDSISYLADPFSHTYYIPGNYTLRLFIESDKFCRDSSSIKLIVEPSSLNIPNVFTPDGDGINDFFYVDNKSLKSIFLQVFSRNGQRVYVFEGLGDALKDWQGWDGTIGSSKASPGVYFYTIRARGWDDVVYEGKEFRGFLYLYR